MVLNPIVLGAYRANIDVCSGSKLPYCPIIMTNIKQRSDIPEKWSKDRVPSSLLEDDQNEEDHNDERVD